MKKLALVSLAIVALSACSDPEPYDQTHNGVLEDGDPRVQDDNSPYDEYTVEAGEGWTLTAEMRSEAFDAYLWVIAPNGQNQQNDDAEGLGRNARIVYTTPERGTYRVRANSFDDSGRGAYTLHITARPAGQN